MKYLLNTFLLLCLTCCASRMDVVVSQQTLEIPKIYPDIPKLELHKNIIGEDSDSHICYSYEELKKINYNNKIILSAYKNIVEKYKLVIDDRNSLADIINREYNKNN